VRLNRAHLGLTALAVWLLTDLWRLFTPSLITLFGQAAETPPELMGAYALAVMASPLLLVVFVRRGSPRLAVWLLFAAFAVRLGLRFNPDGGDFQLYGSSLAVALAVAALCLLAGFVGRALLPGVMLGVAVSASTHAFLGSFGAVWRTDIFDASLLAAQAIVLMVAGLLVLRGNGGEPAGAQLGLLVLPSMLLLQLALVNVGRASTVAPVLGPVVLVSGAWLAVWVSTCPRPTRRPWVAVALLVGAVTLAMPVEVTRDSLEGQLSVWALAAFAFGPAALARVLQFGTQPSTSRRTAIATGVGAVIWTIFLFLFYAGYDLGYRADWAIVALAALLGLAPRWRANETATGRAPIVPGKSRALALAAVVSIAAAAAGPLLTIRPIDSVPSKNQDLTIAAYNLRMGYAMDGTFSPVSVAEQIRDSGAQVVLLSELDRGWLLNGGQDQLLILARLLDMEFVFGPAGDQVWGDAILSSLPLGGASSQKLPKFDSLTGAAMTMATVEFDGEKIQLISTHLQPDTDGETAGQAQVFADQLAKAATQGPVVGGGDLNTEPGSTAWQILLGSGAEDVLANMRPAPTWPADSPSQQIDHTFARGLLAANGKVVASQLSDHLMVLVSFN